MSIYNWSGIDHTGKNITGSSEAENKNHIKEMLAQENIFPIKIIRKVNFYSEQKIKTKHVYLFVEQLAILINANIALVTALNIIIVQEKHKALKKLIIKINNSISSGQSFYQTLSQYPQYFNKIFCNLINVGEQSGTLNIILNELAQYFTKIDSQKRKVKKALLYPAIVLIITFMVIIILLLLVIPQFEAMYSSVGASLPSYTQFILKLANFTKKYFYVIFILFTISIFSIKFGYKYFQKFNRYIDRIILELPIIGSIINYSTTARLIKTIWLAFKSGIPLLEAINISYGIAQNYWYLVAMQNITKLLKNGHTLHEAMEEQKIFPVQIIKLIAVGEETGKLDLMLEKIAQIYTDKLDHIIENLNNLLEPIIMLILGVLVGGLIIGMYLPIFKLGMVI